ncbi:putative major facilitator superfamily domain-containing protein 8 [Apostichopus japonicus]|uniref:Putative major facilitator superfamily domain-containing protein 8 n=1 Tax=Stichopus japonicus TaxID=307972 RepID=A0A2G8JSR0_STIJA|nr:putative major facilitator superfamily domain-containing protein 8 [Apostichopus japonicus]
MQWQANGNLLYFMSSTANMLVLSRFIAGIGAGVGSSMLAQIAHTTTTKERSAAFALFMAARQFGLIIGPALNLFLELFDFTIGQYHCNEYTAPGLFMAAVWSVFQLMVVLFYFDLPFLSDLPAEVRQKVEANGTGVMSSPSEDEITRPLTPKQLTNVLDDDAIDESDRNNHNEYGTAQMSQVQKPTALTMKQKLMVLLREEIVVMLATSFIFFFNQTALEACMTPLTKQFLGVKSFGNSLFFCLAGAEVIVGFVLISKLSKRCQDRLILTIGLLIEIGALIFLCVFLPMSANGRIKTRSINWIWLTMIFMVQVAGLPFILIANVSLLSKLVPEEIQGFSQGVRRSIMGLGTIMGPLWGAGALTVPVSFSTVMVILFIIVQTMVFCSWDKLAEPRQVDQKNHTRITSGTSQRGTSSERTSLLNEHD